MIANTGAKYYPSTPAANADNPRAGLQAEFPDAPENSLFPIDASYSSDFGNPGGGVNFSNGLPDYSLYTTVPRPEPTSTSTTNTTDTSGSFSMDNMADLLDRLFSQSVYVPAQTPQSDVAVVPAQTATSSASILPVLIMAAGAALVGWWYYKKHKKGGE